MRTFQFNKLVRDRIPEEIQKDGGKVFSRVLSPNDFLAELVKKISEESTEINSSLTKPEAVKELADFYEVVSAIKKWFKVTDFQIKTACDRKNRTCGAFAKRIYIDHIEVPDSYPWINHYRKNLDRYQEVAKNIEKRNAGNFQVSVLATIVNGKNQLLMVRRSPDLPHAAGRWECISGRINAGELPVEALKREVAEEAGSNLKIEIIEPYYTFHLVRDDGYEVIGISFYCKYLGGKIKLNHEHTDYRWVTIDQAVNLTSTPGLKKELQYFKKKYLSIRQITNIVNWLCYSIVTLQHFL